jgi:nucleoside-diphosphate-sugar epimerase
MRPRALEPRRLPPLGEGLDVRDVQGGLADPEAWKRALEGVDGVVHLAAQTSTYRAALDPHADFELNARPVLTLLCACRELGLRPAVVLAGPPRPAACRAPLPWGRSIRTTP